MDCNHLIEYLQQYSLIYSNTVKLLYPSYIVYSGFKNIKSTHPLEFLRNSQSLSNMSVEPVERLGLSQSGVSNEVPKISASMYK